MQRPPGSPIPVFAVLQNRAFRAIWYAGSLHEISRRTELLVLSFLILEITQSPFQLLLVLVFNNLPRLLLAPIFGSVADRFSRQRVMVLSQFINVVISAAVLTLILTDLEQPWHLYLALMMQGVTKALEDPSRRTSILDIVGEGRVVNALSLDQIGNTTGKIAGPFLAGLLVETLGFPAAYTFVVVVHLGALGFLTRVRVPPRQAPAQREPVLRSLWVSLRYALGNPLLLGMLYVTIIMNALAFPAQQLIPDIGVNNLGVGETLIGLLVAAEGVGQLVSAALMASSRNLRYHGRVFVIGSVLVLVMAILWSRSPWYGLTAALLIIGGVGQTGFGTMQSSITMLSAPAELRGRMIGLMSFCIGVGTPLGALEMGWLAERVSSSWAISINALAGLALLIPALVLTPLVRSPTSEQRTPAIQG